MIHIFCFFSYHRCLSEIILLDCWRLNASPDGDWISMFFIFSFLVLGWEFIRLLVYVPCHQPYNNLLSLSFSCFWYKWDHVWAFLKLRHSRIPLSCPMPHTLSAGETWGTGHVTTSVGFKGQSLSRDGFLMSSFISHGFIYYWCNKHQRRTEYSELYTHQLMGSSWTCSTGRKVWSSVQ